MINVSIVTYNTPAEDVCAMLESLNKSEVATIYIIDHSPLPTLREKVEKSSSKVAYIHEENVGYGSGHNVGIRRSIADGADYHVVLNPDLSWKGDIIAPLRKFMDENPDCGLVMPKTLYPGGHLQRNCKLLPTPFDLILRRFFPVESIIGPRNDRYELKHMGYDAIFDVPFLSGCFMFLRLDVVTKVGPFDERFFMYAEDIDLCRRIGTISRTVFFPEVVVTHAFGRGSYKNPKLLYYHIRSVCQYFNKWGWWYDPYRYRKNKECLKAIAAKNS